MCSYMCIQQYIVYRWQWTFLLFVEEGEGHEDDQLGDTEVAELIDEIMKEDDLNNDGYIDYAEFVSSQQRADNQDNV